MAPRHARDEQPRERWPVNAPADQSRAGARLASRPATAPPVGAGAAPGHAQVRHGPGSAATAPARANLDAAPRAGTRTVTSPPDRAPAPSQDEPNLAALDFSAYVQEQMRRQQREGPPDRAGADERDSFERVGRGSLYRSGDLRTDDRVDDTVLGLSYANVAPRAPMVDERWAGSLRAFSRAAVWCLPAAVVCLALSSGFGWPTRTDEPALVSPGTWVLVTVLGLGLWLIGVAALAALVASSAMRRWSWAAVIASCLGVALLAPVVGVVGFARPAISRSAQAVENDTAIAAAADRMQDGLVGSAAARGMLVLGAALLAIGAIAVAGTILGSRVLQRHDAWLMLMGIGIAIAAAYLSWPFLFTLAAMVALAGGLGLAYTVSRIAPDGTPPPAY